MTHHSEGKERERDRATARGNALKIAESNQAIADAIKNLGGVVSAEADRLLRDAHSHLSWCLHRHPNDEHAKDMLDAWYKDYLALCRRAGMAE